MIYLVESSFGSYDDVYELLNGAFSTKEKAEEIKHTIEDKIKHISKIKDKINLNDLVYSNLEKYDYYSELFQIEEEYNFTKIIPIEVDEPQLHQLTDVYTRNDKLKRLLKNG